MVERVKTGNGISCYTWFLNQRLKLKFQKFFSQFFEMPQTDKQKRRENMDRYRTNTVDLTGDETVDLTEETKVLLNVNPFLGQLQALKEKMQKREEKIDDLKKLEVLVGLARIEHELVGYLLVGEGKAELNDEYTRCVRSALDQARKICARVTSST